MRITSVTGIPVSTAFDYGNPAGPGGNLHLRAMDTLLVKVETDIGVTGWGEGFGFSLVPVTAQVLNTLIAPACVGEEPQDIPGLMTRLARRFHNFGLNGAVTFALSGVDIALWDIAAKVAGQPLHALLGGKRRGRVPAYASLLRYGEPKLVAENTARAVALGYRQIKLHEVRLDCVRAARMAAPAAIPLMLDVNCAWPGVAQAVEFCGDVQGMNVRWVEEPIWPPEDFAAIAEVRREGGIGIAAGECLGSVAALKAMLQAGAVDVVQPSITKCGGLSAMLEMRRLAAQHGVALVPHCPYFGPGLLATLHFLAAAEVEEPLEYYFAELARPPFPALIPRQGFVAVPDTPGLGYEPAL
jgi:D-galactarolactone cycloisomerase